MKKLIQLLLLLPLLGMAQTKIKLDKESGYFQLGVRNTASAFSDDGAMGFGYGGQFRIRLSKRINTDWYADYLTTNIQNVARRTDGHIGWSVLAYPFNCEMIRGRITPYVLAGHCFDYTKVSQNGATNFKDRLSSAVQAGCGMHYNITNQTDISLTGQYMMHIGQDIHAHVTQVDQLTFVEIEKQNVSGVEGHLLINLSLNVKLFDMWGQANRGRN
ncbi:MAG TPA: outer membrane beta-barrel protein [Bacteroidia bacterium]|nr:outer membrane beta-barrel protein [Bacteroidia bacterium]HRH07979.1 outer membrane beta-barrel protein [Bacteroidia bacterium]HRH63110.1 outer membrane beta-barrel protein [Bacteroidia bacterium]